MAIRMGSWGLPEFGLTEKLGGFLSGGRTTDLSNAISGNYSRAQTQPQVYGMSTQSQMSTQPQMSRNVASPSYSQPAQQPQQQQQGPDWGQQEENARSQAQIELEQALGQYDYLAEQAQNQITSLGTQKQSSMTDLGMALGKSQTQAASSKSEAEESTRTAKESALSTSQDVTRKNRNVLRAMGILSSSAAGEMLARPTEEYAKQSATLEQGLIKRKQVVDDWLGERTAEHQKSVDDLNQNYNNLVNQIQTDLRFNERQRIDAVKSAQAALQSRLGDIQQSAAQYQQAAQQYNANILSQIAQLKLYQNPQADVSGILSQMINVQNPSYTGGQASIMQSEEQRKKNQNLLSGY